MEKTLHPQYIMAHFKRRPYWEALGPAQLNFHPSADGLRLIQDLDPDCRTTLQDPDHDTYHYFDSSNVVRPTMTTDLATVSAHLLFAEELLRGIAGQHIPREMAVSDCEVTAPDLRSKTEQAEDRIKERGEDVTPTAVRDELEVMEAEALVRSRGLTLTHTRVRHERQAIRCRYYYHQMGLSPEEIAGRLGTTEDIVRRRLKLRL